MKKLRMLLLIAVAAVSLTTAAHADAISVSPAEAALELGERLLPWLLVGAVVVATAILLRRFRKK